MAEGTKSSKAVEEAELRIRLLGGFQVSIGPRVVADNEWRLRKAKSLVKLLALAPGHRLHRDQLLELLWPDLDPQAAYNNLRKVLHVARRVIEQKEESSGILHLQGEQIALCSPESLRSLWVDVVVFEDAAAKARRSENLEAFRAAIELYGGDLLPEDRYEEWAITRREDLRATYVALLVRLAQFYEARGDFAPAIEALRQGVEIDPLNEVAHTAVMRLYALDGQRHEALRQYRQLQEVLRRELDAEPEEGTRRLHEEIQAGRFPPDRPIVSTPAEPEPRRHNLPIQLTSFIGREREVEEVGRHLHPPERLPGTRLLTLTGPGGCGKTRLALEVAAQLVDDYPEGVWLVELAALSDPALVPQSVASALSVREEPDRTLTETLANSLRSKKLLILLDNCEHLVEACAKLVERLLRSCLNSKVLATSREALNIPGEVAWLVPSLSLPEPWHAPPLETLAQYEAVQLFVERAAAVLPSFRLTGQNAAAVGQICHRLDGIPLAIELAAARIRVLSPQEIAERLDHSFQLLTAGSRTALPRHRTLSATIEWSYNLLSDKERTLFRRLPIFAGGFTMEAAEEVCSGLGLERHEVLDTFSHLVSKSLVMVLEREQSTLAWYRLLETLRQYGHERLTESGEFEEVSRLFTGYHVALAERAEPGMRGLEKAEWLNRLEWEHDNLRAALDWCREHDALTGLRLAGSLWRFWWTRGHLYEGRRWLEGILANAQSVIQIPATPGDADNQAGSDAARYLAKALLGSGTLAWLQGDNAAGCSRLEESVAVSRGCDDKAGLASALHYLGHATFDHGNYPGARDLFEESLAVSRQLGETRVSHTLVGDLGLVAYHEGDYAGARALFEESLAGLRELGIKDSIGEMLNRLGDLARIDGDHERAVELYEQSLAIFKGLDEALGIASAIHKLGYIAQHRGEYRRAEALFEESLGLQRKVGNKQGIIECLAGLAGLAAAEGHFERAATLFGAVEGLLEAVKVPLAPADRIEYERDMAFTSAHLDERTFAAAWAQGRVMTLEEAIGFALATS